jgi:two-component system, sensor histidine kinase and response regulator
MESSEPQCSLEMPLNILVVDDDDVDRMAVKRALIKSEIPCTITEATNYEEAIGFLKTRLFDCTFLDYGLPDRNGLALVQAARSLNVQHPLVVLTGQGDERVAVDLMKAGATDYLAKSYISPVTLAQILRNAIRIDRAEREIQYTSQKLKENNALLLIQNHDLEHQRAQIDVQNLQRDDFISHLTHDLRTPLVAANLMFKLFSQEAFCPLSPEMHEAVTAMDRSNQSLLDLVNTLLEINCYESGMKKLTFTDCNLWEILENVIQELKPLANHKSIELKAISQTANPMDLTILGDRLEIRRMLTNLIGNSLKFTEIGGVEIRLNIVISDETPSDRRWLTIEIQDTGLGMSPAEQSFIFQRFRSGNHSQAGSGLGLHLVHRIISEHSGMISVTSTLGEGSLFKVRLPMRASNS